MSAGKLDGAVYHIVSSDDDEVVMSASKLAEAVYHIVSSNVYEVVKANLYPTVSRDVDEQLA